MIGEYLIQKHIGEGTYGAVKLAVHLTTNKRVAIKLASKEEATKEHGFLSTLYHPNVIKPIEVLNVPMNLRAKKSHEQALVMQYVEGGDLLDYVGKNGPLNEKMALKFLTQLMSALSHCHRMRIAHRDVKPENLLVDVKNENVVLCDFGLSTNYHPNKFLQGRVGSLLYCAPELLLNNPYVGPEVDIWSAGVVLYAMVSGCIPWEGTDQQSQIRNAVIGRYYKLPYVSREITELIDCMLQVNPRSRPTADQILKRLEPTQGISQQPKAIQSNLSVLLEEDGEISGESQCDSLPGSDSDGMEADGESFESPPPSPKQIDLRIIPVRELKASIMYQLAFVEAEVLCQSIERALQMLNIQYEKASKKRSFVQEGYTKYRCICAKSSFELEIGRTSEKGSKVIVCQNVKGNEQDAKMIMNVILNKCPFL